MARQFLNIEKKTDSPTVRIYGEIGWDNENWGDGTNNTDIATVQRLEESAKGLTRLDIFINSFGGSMDAGLAIFNCIQRLIASGVDVHTHNDGVCASMAGIILLAPGKRENIHIPATSVLHIHRAINRCVGNVNDFQEMIVALEAFEESIISAITKVTLKTAEEIKTTYFDGKDHFLPGILACELGFGTVSDMKPKFTPAETSNLKNVFKNLLNVEMKTFFSVIKNKSNQKIMKKIVIGSDPIAKIIRSFELNVSDDGHVEVSETQFSALTSELTRAHTAENELTGKLAEKETANATMLAELTAAKAKIEKLEGTTPPEVDPKNPTPGDTPVNLIMDTESDFYSQKK